ncbi:cyclodehydratase [Mycolicibacterium cosmeticum]|uniref:Bacteriocin biosynthesis cyclodehydratase domain protein n=1 Tax=Mycolicibacterium cosmeticum TaxID=258533 RepID=W9B5F5_MYCCO|nr:cyclodehydratase [Mycolicibacterium cosmeticum]TLH81600.1 cyclodehydratase [Mycolicibacterium cosmeticum]CDO10252.1 bacteriocin biosynthesis cyclodehydratase domain protein [Mycolicibacterium cosmeticum]
MRRYLLNPSMPVLLRPDDTVQVGWDPRRAVVVHPPAGIGAAALATLLRGMQAAVTRAELSERAARLGVPESALSDLLDALRQAGVLTAGRPAARTVTIRIHGRGPLSDLLTGALRCSGNRVTQSSRPHAVVSTDHADLVLLTDALVADPRVVRDLHAAALPHLPVRIRDGTGLVGPLVIPGVTSCLACADRHRRDRDAAWPAVAAQLRHTVGAADRATLMGTAALALNQVDRVVSAMRSGESDALDAPEPPMTLDTTLEFDVGSGSVLARRWSRHPGCPC